jgi:acyl carrier protein
MKGIIIKTLTNKLIQLARETSNETISLGVDENILENGILDSPGIINLVCFIEEEYNITIEQEEMNIDNFESIMSIEKFIENKLNSNEK